MRVRLLASIILAVCLIGLVSAADSVIRNGNCNAGETCLMSLYQNDDSHVAQCGYYNFSVCYPNTVPVTTRDGGCNGGEYSLISKYQQNDSHAASQGYFNYSICVQSGNSSYIQASCNAGDIGIVSMYQIYDRHVGSIGYYNFTLCENQTVIPIVPDVTPPVFTNCRNLTDYVNNSFSQSIIATDNVAIGSYILNETDVFNISITTGLIINITAMNKTNLYNLNLTVNDTSGNTAECDFWINIINPSPSSGGTTISTQICRYKKYGYYNLKLPWFRQENCI